MTKTKTETGKNTKIQMKYERERERERERCVFSSLMRYVHIYKCNKATDAKANAIHTMQ